MIGLIVLAAIASAAYLRMRSIPVPAQDGDEAASLFKTVPVTSAAGEAISPAISPDGLEVAYLWDGPERKRHDLYVQLIGSDTPLRLTYSKNGLVGAPAWSRDGREIAFTRCDGKNDGIYVVPAPGGAERKLTSALCPEAAPGPLAWLSDGKGMLMVDHCPGAGSLDLVLFSLVTGERQCLTHSGTAAGFDNVFQFSQSPDGGTIAFHCCPK